jgi:hypothetical protein
MPSVAVVEPARSRRDFAGAAVSVRVGPVEREFRYEPIDGN